MAVDVFAFVDLTEGVFADFAEVAFGVAVVRVDLPFAGVSFAWLFEGFVLAVFTVSLVRF